MHVVWSTRAVSRLRDIHLYLRHQAPAHADAVIARLIHRIDLLSNSPRTGRRLTVFADEEIRELLERPFRIVYRLGGDRLEVLTVKHYRQRLTQAPDFEC